MYSDVYKNSYDEIKALHRIGANKLKCIFYVLY